MPSKLQQRKQARRELNQRTGGGRGKDYLKQRHALLPNPKTKSAPGLKGKLAKLQSDFERILQLDKIVRTARANKIDFEKYVHIERERDALKKSIFVNYDFEQELNEYFKQKYGQEYNQMKFNLNRSGISTGYRGDLNGLMTISNFLKDLIFDRKTHKPKNLEPHLVVFPMLGSMWNYLFAKGLLEELQRRGLGENIKLITFNITSRSYPNATIADLNRQVNTIIKQNPNVKTVSIFDFVSDGTTKDRLKELFQSKGINSEHYNVGDHQVLADKSNTNLWDVFAKIISPDGKQLVVRLSDLKKFKGKGYKYYMLGELFDLEDWIAKDLSLLERKQKLAFKSKELLYVFGRLYYYTDFIKDVLRDIH